MIAGQIRWVTRTRQVTEPQMRGGSIVYGGKSRRVTEHYQVLQQALPSSVEGAQWEWRDVPTERDTNSGTETEHE